MSAICGRSCAITGTFGAFEGFDFSVTQDGVLVETTVFGDGPFGNFTACGIDGIVNLRSYARPTVSIGDTGTFAANVGAEIFSAPIVVQGQTIPVNGQLGQVVIFETPLKITGTVTIA